MMQPNGRRASAQGIRENAVTAILSDPATGVIGAAQQVSLVEVFCGEERIAPETSRRFELSAGHVVFLRASGGADYGDPALREESLSLRDGRGGFITAPSG
ncbi:hypothetical protein [Pikeienuella piscinae]|nr:hypothetical protein [Pikeienuella piscinae]